MDTANSTVAGVEVAEETVKEKKVPLLINRNYALLFWGRAISIIGDVIFASTLGLWVALGIARGQSWAPLALGGVLLASIIPTLALGSAAGVFVDRWIKRHTMLRMDGARAILILLLLLMTGTLPPFSALPAIARLIIVYVIVFLSNVCSQFFNPSSFAIIADIVPDKYRARATGFEQAVSGLAYVLGPPLAVVLFLASGPQVAILFNALSFAISFLAIYFIRVPQVATDKTETEKESFFQAYFGGLRFIGQHRVLLAVLIGAFLVVIPEGAQNALGLFFYEKNLQAPLALFGLVGGATGAGAILGALMAALFAQRLGAERVFSAALLCVGILMIVYARTNNLVIALISIFLTGFLVAVVNVAVSPIVLSTTPRNMLGRIAATATSTLSLASLLSISVLSYLASTVLHNFHVELAGNVFSTYDVIFACSGLIAALGGVYAVSALWKTRPSETENPT